MLQRGDAADGISRRSHGRVGPFGRHPRHQRPLAKPLGSSALMKNEKALSFSSSHCMTQKKSGDFFGLLGVSVCDVSISKSVFSLVFLAYIIFSPLIMKITPSSRSLRLIKKKLPSGSLSFVTSLDAKSLSFVAPFLSFCCRIAIADR